MILAAEIDDNKWRQLNITGYAYLLYSLSIPWLGVLGFTMMQGERDINQEIWISLLMCIAGSVCVICTAVKTQWLLNTTVVISVLIPFAAIVLFSISMENAKKRKNQQEIITNHHYIVITRLVLGVIFFLNIFCSFDETRV